MDQALCTKTKCNQMLYRLSVVGVSRQMQTVEEEHDFSEVFFDIFVNENRVVPAEKANANSHD